MAWGNDYALDDDMIAVLLTAGHRLCNALLTEARVALADDDWPDAADRLQEFASRMERHMHAEEVIVFPWIAGHSPGAGDALARCGREHQELRARLRMVLQDVAKRDKPSAAQAISELMDFLSCHCMAEEQMIYSLSRNMDERTVMALARALSGPEAGAPASPTGPVLPLSHQLH